MSWLIPALLGHALAADRVTLLHTNDWQSRLLGTPNGDYTPHVAGDDDSRGGVARLATLVAQRRAAHAHPVFLLDAGDITMGSLFHLVSRERGTELQLMARLDYDGAALGNHDFDFRPDGLADMILAAKAGAGIPPLLASNIRFDDTDPRDDRLLARVQAGDLLDRHLVERSGLTLGLMGILGKDATEKLGQAAPVTWTDPIATATEVAQDLRANGADLVVALSHSGVSRQADGTWGDEDVELAQAVPGLDVVISGHSHTPLPEPILVDGRPVVQAGSDTMYLGELTLERNGSGWSVAKYTLHDVDDGTLGDPAIQAEIDEAADFVSAQFLAPMGLAFDTPIAEVAAHMGRAQDDPLLGNLVTDAFRLAADADLAVTGNGALRADLGAGPLQLSDLFLVSSLGVGNLDDSPGYPLVKVWFTGSDLKDVLEFLLVGYVLKGEDYFPRISGARVGWSGWRVPTDQIHTVELGDPTRGYTPAILDDEHLYSVAMSTYVAGFMPQVAALTGGVLEARPRNAQGEPVADPGTLLVDGDPSQPGVQELKAWRALLDHVRSLPDADADGLPELPAADARAPRLNREDGLGPGRLLGLSAWRQKLALALPLGLVSGVLGLAIWWRRRRAQSQAGKSSQ